MDDLVRKQAVIETLEDYGEHVDHRRLIDIIRAMPNAQSDIITCAECKHFCNITRYDSSYSRCGQTGFRVQEFDFCSMARRRKQL